MTPATLAHPASSTEGATLRRRTLGDFVRNARARITPQMAGLPAGLRRRTPGLRREEVAQLCGISVTWYTWIEQGREVSVSPAVWARIASVLQLARAERAYLFELAECADPQHPRDEPSGVSGILAACVDAIDAPAYVLDRTWNVMAYNEAMRDLFDNWPVVDPAPNLLRYIFLDPAARELVVDWEQRARRAVAEFRHDAGPHLDEQDVRDLLDPLLRDSPAFEHWWTRHAVVEREGGLREFQHPRLGLLRFQQVTFRLATHADLKLIMLLAEAKDSALPG